ncbi:hypothetical protein Q8A67_001499 [Cirrhinus molitorella]|uniref:Ig-like domain-containing protein n=1 Tax=Cirrhinus molitorella TaxID=172907 RepID=A0AA88U159_9TELE|nr:hypothetical protein Q8A67_001499 [Cirrhinus molitorella]
MHRMNCVLMSALLMIADGLIVKGPSGPLVAPLGSSVVLPCYVDELSSVEGLEVEWKRTDSKTLVHLFQDGESQAESQHKDYQDRAHFFTEEIQHGNFSLRLDNLRAEDEGQYTCNVYIQQESGENVVQIKVDNVERLRVSGSSRSISASVGEDVTLNCSVDSHITPEDFEEVSWKKTDEDKDIMVLLFQNNEALPDSAHERYTDRVEFFTDEIPKGNFSLRLKSVRTEDKGVYMCQVFAGGLSANTTVVLEQLGFSVLHIMVLILCISASGSALLLFCLIYCRSTTEDTVFRLQMFLVFCPSLLMFLAFVLWGFSEGSLSETLSCCALYFLRPLLLLWASPFMSNFTGTIKSLILKYSYVAEYLVLSLVVYSALFTSAWQKLLSYTAFDRAVIIALFVIVFVCCLCKIIYILVTEVGKKSGRIIKIFNVVADMTFEILPTLQFVLLFYTFGSAGAEFIIIILPVLLMMTNDRWFFRCRVKLNCSFSAIRTTMLIFIIVTNVAMISVYIFTLENKTDAIGWACVIVFLQILWMVMKFTDVTFGFLRLSRDFHRFVPVYVFGSVGVVLLNSAALITELILKTVNGDRMMADLRFTVFPTECLFAIFVLISAFFPSAIAKCLESCQNIVKSRQTPDSRSQENQNTAEMSPLNTEVQGENQLHSVESQT